MIEYSTWRMGVDIVQFATTVGVWVYAWRKSRQKATDERFKALEDRTTKVESDVQELRVEVQHPKCPHHPGFEQRLDKLNDNIAKQGAGINKIEGRMEGVGNALDLIQQHLLSGGK